MSGTVVSGLVQESDDGSGNGIPQIPANGSSTTGVYPASVVNVIDTTTLAFQATLLAARFGLKPDNNGPNYTFTFIIIDTDGQAAIVRKTSDKINEFCREVLSSASPQVTPDAPVSPHEAVIAKLRQLPVSSVQMLPNNRGTIMVWWPSGVRAYHLSDIDTAGTIILPGDRAVLNQIMQMVFPTRSGGIVTGASYNGEMVSAITAISPNAVAATTDNITAYTKALLIRILGNGLLPSIELNDQVQALGGSYWIDCVSASYANVYSF